MWHRSLHSPTFLASLPYGAANNLLNTMADAMREKMRDQNARPRQEVGDVEWHDGKTPAITMSCSVLKNQTPLDSIGYPNSTKLYRFNGN